MSILLALPQSITTRSPPSALDADFSYNKQRPERPSSIRTGTSPHLLRRAIGGRIARPRSSPSLSISLRNQQILWEQATGRDWQLEEVGSLPESTQSLQYITPQSLSTSPAPSVAPSSPALSLEPAVTTPVIAAGTPLDPSSLFRYGWFGDYLRPSELKSAAARWTLWSQHNTITSARFLRATPRVCNPESGLGPSSC